MHETGSSQRLPTEVTSFVGRRAERQQIRTLLSHAPLVTLIGFGGIGKTRLALRVAADLRRAFADGVAFVPLTAQSDPDLVAQSIVDALGIQGRSTKAVTAALVEHLTGRATLLILDNCEHLIDAVAVLCDTLLRTCPELRIIATSREPLRIDGEAVHPVAPLSVPSAADADTPAEQSESVSLFLDRARAAVPGFGLDETNRDAVISIVCELQGIPLAIELAAGRLRAMTPVELHQNLSERWDLLSRGSRAAPNRQRTMRACIEWSFDLCSPDEQAHWGALSVFADGFELDAARFVCAPLGSDVDDMLHSLVEKSIVIAQPTTGGRTRFRMLPPIRYRGIVQVTESGNLEEVQRRHRDWVLDYSRAAKREWMGPGQVALIRRLRLEMPNVQTALEFCLSQPGELEPGLEMGSNLLEFGLADGLFRQGRLWFSRLLEKYHESTEVRALALRTSCWWAAMQGDLDAAARQLEEGRVIAAAFGGHTEALFTQASAFLAMFTGDHDGAAVLYDQAIADLEKFGDFSQIAHSHALAALNHAFRGDPDAALRSHEACRHLTESVGESWYLSYSLWIAGLAHWARGDLHAAEGAEKDSLRLKRETADRLGISVSLEALAWMGAADSPERAARLLGAAQAQFEQIQTSTQALAGLHVHHVACVEQVKTALGAERYAELVAEGRALSPLASIDFALEASPTARARSRAPRRVSTGLTKRELQIAGMVADGLSNRDIATSLVISKRTAETHVEHILVKLGFTNRNQIAAWVADSQPTGAGAT